MTSSRSTASTSSWFGLAVAVAIFGVAVLLLAPANAQAGGRKRVVVLELEGPKAEKFHEDLVKLIKKSHTVIPIEKWNEKADELDASKASDKNFKKVAKKLKIDAIITGKIDKRRDEYIIKLKVRAGKTGELVGEGVDTKADGPRIDGKAQRDIKDELIGAIDNVGANRASGGGEDEDEDEDKPAKKKAIKNDEDEEDEDKPIKKKGFSKKDDEEEEDKPVKKGFSRKNDEEEEDKPVKKGFSKKDDEEEEDKPSKKKPAKKDDEEEEDKPVKKGFSRKDDDTTAALKSKKDDEDEDPLPKPTKKKPAAKDDEEEDEDGDKPTKKVASKDEDEDEDEDGNRVEKDADDEEEAAAPMSALSPGERAIDATIGLSLNARRMSFAAEAGLAAGPPPYKGVPVAGLLIDATVYPGAIGHKRKGMAKNFGATIMFDKVLKISSKAGNPPVSLPTSQSRYAIGAAFRYPIGALTIGATLRYGRQSFNISPSGGVMPDIPNVNYTIIDPSVMMKYQATPKVILGVNLGFMLLTNTGQIQNPDQYGPATVSGFEGEFGGDYLLTKNIFVRAAFKFETIGFKFRGGAMKTNTKYDADNGQDVFGARDTYLGGAATVGYLY